MKKISDKLRQQVINRAQRRCEYCHLLGIDHIIAQKHGGGDELENLAYCCPHCNQL